jgi:hypothetical protein
MNRELASRLFAAVLLSLLGGWGATVKGRADLAQLDADPEKYIAHLRHLKSASFGGNAFGLALIAIGFVCAVEVLAYLVRRFVFARPAIAQSGSAA